MIIFSSVGKNFNLIVIYNINRDYPPVNEFFLGPIIRNIITDAYTMIIWILNSDSGLKILYKSFLKTDADEDIVSGFLTAFHHFSLEEFHQSLESLEMGGLRWIYTLESEYNLLFVAADTKNIKTEMLMGRLNAIKQAFIKEFKPVWLEKGRSWEGNLNVYLPFLDVIEDYYNQWVEVETLSHVADFFDILGVFQHLLIMLRNIIDKKMYSRSKLEVLDSIENRYNSIGNQEEFKDLTELENITYSKGSWFNIIDANLIKCDQVIVIKYLRRIIMGIVDTLKEVKGKTLCFKYFSEERVYSYIFNNLKLLKDLNIDTYLLDLFLLL